MPVASEPTRPRFNGWIVVAVGFEFSLAGIAWLLGWFVGVDPFRGLAWSDLGRLGQDLSRGALAVLPLWLALLWVRASRWTPWRELRRLLHEHLLPLLANASVLELAWIALAAGVGEEILFRGFLLQALQAYLDPLAVGGWLPLILSSLLFGMAHAVSWSYLGLATVVGGYLGLLLAATDSLWVPMTTHAVYDFVALCYLCRDHQKKGAA
jgi:membrane protease YdiL (CAAX protease family)